MTTVADRAPRPEAQIEEASFLWKLSIRREMYRWSTGEPCTVCGEWVGHHGGDALRDPCACIPLDVLLEEVRPNRYTVRRHWIGDAIRAACAKGVSA